MIPGDEQHANPCLVAFDDGIWDLGPKWVLETKEAFQTQSLFELFLLPLDRLPRNLARGHRYDSLPFRRQFIDQGAEIFCNPDGMQGPDFSPRTVGQHDIRHDARDDRIRRFQL